MIVLYHENHRHQETVLGRESYFGKNSQSQNYSLNNQMTATPFLEEILHLVTLFLQKSGHEETAAQLQEHYTLPSWIEHNNPLLKKGLIKIVKDYVKTNPKLKHYYETRTSDSEEEAEEEVIQPEHPKKNKDKVKKVASPMTFSKMTSPKMVCETSPKIHTRATSPKPNGSSWMSKFQQPKRLQELNSPRPLEVLPKAKVEEDKVHKPKHHKKVQHHIESSQYESEEDSFELQPKKKLKKQVKASKVESKKVEKEHHEVKHHKKAEIKPQNEEEPQNEIVYEEEKKNGKKGPLKFFSRVNADEVGPIKHELRDNSFQAKGKYGQAADDWGVHGYERLKDTRGDSFKKTKGKLKNKAFQGAMMDFNKINSIPIL